MEENMNPEKNSTGEMKKPAAAYDYDKIKEEILNDLNNNQKYKSFFDEYNQMSIRRFKEYYSGKKAFAVYHGDLYEGVENNMTLMFREMAENHIWRIQQRKLFDLQCRWRAEEISLKGVTITADFKIWEKRIDDCPFITPISQEEFDLYMQFASESNYDDVIDEEANEWQEYEDFKEHYFNEESENYFTQRPCWYEFYENKTGLNSLHLLDDVRGRKEEFYCNLAREEDRKKYEETNKGKPVSTKDGRPEFDHLDKDVLDIFMEKFEDAKIINKMNAFENGTKYLDDIEFEQAMQILKYADPFTPVEFNEDWRAGIVNAAGEYTRRKLLEELPKAYRNYLFRLKNGLAFELYDKHGNDFIKEIYVDLILRGRILNGEPADFNF
ncbi:MAG: hypothetical protein M1480_19075 [Bacteroidetes bacterium]|nr:hypothetical protein [Bacteroidota bacterium]